MTQIFNKKELKQRRQMLRRNMTAEEITLWSRLRRKQVGTFRFRRQYSVGKFVLDFYCPGVKLDIEVDGESHNRTGTQENTIKSEIKVSRVLA